MLIITPPSSRPPTVHQRAITAVPAHPLPGPAMIAHQKLCRWPRAGRRTSLTVQATSLPTVGLVDRPACKNRHATSVLLASLAAAAQVLVLPGPATADTPTSASQPTVDAVARAPQSPSSPTDASSPGSLVEELQVSASHMASALQSVGITAEASTPAPPSSSRPQPAVADVAEAAPQTARPAAVEVPSSLGEPQAPLAALSGGMAGPDRGDSAAGGQLMASSLQQEAPPLASGKAPEGAQPVLGGMLSQQQEPAGGASLAGPQEALGLLAADVDEVLSAADLPVLEAPDLPSYEELLAMYGLGSPAEVTTAAGGEAGGALLAGSDSLAASQRAVAAIPAKAEQAAAGNNSQAPAQPAAGSRAAPQEVISAIAELEQGVAAGDSLAAPQEAAGSDARDGKQLAATIAAAAVEAKDLTNSEGVDQQAVRP